MDKPKIFTFPTDGLNEKRRIFLFNNKLGKIIPSPPPPAEFTIIEESENEITFIYNGVSDTYEIVDGQNGTKWLNKNLGASRVANAIDDEESYGDTYQWGRFKDGHEKRTSNTTSELATTNTPNHGDFITNTNTETYRDWRSPQNDGLWQPSTRINMPAPVGWRIPTYAEFLAERDSWATSTSDEALASNLKLPSTGGRENNGNFGGVGNSGAYWTSIAAGTGAGVLNFSTSGTNLMNNIFRAFGLPIRLIKDTPPPESIIIYEGVLTPEYNEGDSNILGYSNWPEDPEFGIHGSIDPFDENILNITYGHVPSSILVVGYHLTKLSIDGVEYTQYNQVTDETDPNIIGTIFSDEGLGNPFTENISVDIILYE
jgi:hypothetical protein